MLHNIIVQKIKIEETNLIRLQIDSSQWFCLFLINLLISKIFLDYLCTWVFACLSVCLVPGSLGGHKSTSDSLELYCEWLWDRMWMLGTEPRYSERATRALSLWATSPAMRLILFGVWVCSVSMGMCACEQVSSKARRVDPFSKAQVSGTGSLLTWVLGTTPSSSTRKVSALKYWAISPTTVL